MERPTNIAPTLDSFLGREGELKQLRSWVGEQRVIVLVGHAGAGKTRLSRELAAQPEVAQQFEAAWLCDLSGARGAHDLVDALAEVWDVAPDGATVLERSSSLTVEAASRPRSLLILDSFETVLEGASPMVLEWATQMPHTFVITSTMRVDMRGFQHLEVGPLDVEAAAQLFLERGYAESGRAPAPDVSSVAVRIAERLDGLPLAVELAARHTDVLSAAEIESHLDAAFELLTSAPRDAPQRHRSLSAMVEWGWSRLEARERELMEAASVFDGGFTIAALTEVIDKSVGDVRERLQALRRKSMVVLHGFSSESTKFALLHTLRTFAAGRLAVDPERRERYNLRHLRHYAELARTWLPTINRNRRERGFTDPDRANLVLALRRAVEADLSASDFDAAIQVGLALRVLHDRQGVVPDTAELLSALVADGASREELDLEAYIRLRAECGELLRRAGDLRGEEEIAAAVEQARACGSAPALARSLVLLGEVLFIRGEQEAGLEAYSESVEAAVRAGDARLELDARQSFASARAFVGPLDLEEHEKIYALAVEVEDDWVQATTLTNLALRFRTLGQHEAAIPRFRTAIERLGEIGDEATAGHVMLFLGVTHLSAGELDEAESVLVRAKTLLHHRGPEIRHIADIAQARVLIARGEHDVAEALLTDVIAHARSESASELEALVLLERYYLACVGRDESRVRREVAALPEFSSIRSLEPRQHARALRAVVEDLDAGGSPALGTLADELREAVPAIQAFVTLQMGVVHLIESWRPEANLKEARAAIHRQLDSLPDEPEFQPEGIYELRRWIDLLTAAARPAVSEPPLLVRGTYAAVQPPDGEWIDLRRKGRTRAVIRVLIERHLEAEGTPLSPEELFAAAWPDTTIRHDSAMARVYTAMSEIRKMGFDTVLVSTDLGYLIRPGVTVELTEDAE